MAYLGKSTRERPPGASGPAWRGEGPSAPQARPSAAPSSSPPAPRAALRRRWELPEETERVSIFGAGLAVGLTVGAGLALLLAPRTGIETRSALRRSARRAGLRGRDAWDDLREELRHAAHRGRRGMGRAVKRSGWAAADLLEEQRLRRRRRRAQNAEDC